MVQNSIVNDPILSAKAKGLYLYLVSKPPKWHFSARRISDDFKDGEDSIKSGLQELESCRVLRRTRKGNGRVSYELLYKDFRNDESIQKGKIPSRENPIGEKSHRGKTPSVNKTLDQVRKSYKKKEGEKEELPSDLLESFSLFFDSYQKPFNREQCLLEWRDLSSEEREAAIEFIEPYKLFEPDPKFRKHPNNYLIKRFWEKEGKAILKMMEAKKSPKVFYSHQQMIHRVTTNASLSTDNFERVKHPDSSEAVWVMKDEAKEVV